MSRYCVVGWLHSVIGLLQNDVLCVDDSYRLYVKVQSCGLDAQCLWFAAE